MNLSKNRIYYFLLSKLEKILQIRIPSTWLELDWVSSHPWEIYSGFGETHHLNAFRRQNLIDAFRQVCLEGIPGDVLECGVYKGLTAKILGPNIFKKKYFGIDTFEGLTDPLQIDGTYWQKGDLSAPMKGVSRDLKSLGDSVVLIQGVIPNVFENPEISRQKFCFVHIDVDLYSPTKESLHFAWERLSTGGVMVCDDYGFSTCPGATKAVEEFLQTKKNLTIVRFSTGGVWMKKNA
jgi:O-methyltransferase